MKDGDDKSPTQVDSAEQDMSVPEAALEEVKECSEDDKDDLSRELSNQSRDKTISPENNRYAEADDSLPQKDMKLVSSSG